MSWLSLKEEFPPGQITRLGTKGTGRTPLAAWKRLFPSLCSLRSCAPTGCGSGVGDDGGEEGGNPNKPQRLFPFSPSGQDQVRFALSFLTLWKILKKIALLQWTVSSYRLRTGLVLYIPTPALHSDSDQFRDGSTGNIIIPVC